MESTTNTDIVKIFQELEETAKVVNPALEQQIKAYSDNKAAIDVYQQFILNSENSRAIYSVSNHTL